MPTLEQMKKMIVNQAIKKGWNQQTVEMFNRLDGEEKELEIAINCDYKSDEIAFELVDCIYFLLQIAENKCPDVNLDEAFNEKYMANWVNKKKTRIGGKIVHK